MLNDQMVQAPAGASPAAVVLVEGDLVAPRLPALRAKLREMVSSGVRDLTLDVQNVQMVDSAGIGLLISAHNSLKKLGGALTVTHASGEVLDLFRTMRIHQHFTVSGS